MGVNFGKFWSGPFKTEKVKILSFRKESLFCINMMIRVLLKFRNFEFQKCSYLLRFFDFVIKFGIWGNFKHTISYRELLNGVQDLIYYEGLLFSFLFEKMSKVYVFGSDDTNT